MSSLAYEHLHIHIKKCICACVIIYTYYLIVLSDVTKDQTESASTGTYVYVAVFILILCKLVSPVCFLNLNKFILLNLSAKSNNISMKNQQTSKSTNCILVLYNKIQHSGLGLMTNTALSFTSCCICHSTPPLVLYFII